MGKAILAFLPESERNELLGRLELIANTPTTITDPNTLIEELTTIKARKYSIDNEESEEGVRCVGAPIFDYNRNVLGAISVSGPAYRLSESRLIALSTLVMDTAMTISGRLGYIAEN